MQPRCGCGTDATGFRPSRSKHRQDPFASSSLIHRPRVLKVWAGRDTLTEVDGLLLKWESPDRHPIWMKGMRFPLDLVWLDADGRVVAALTNVPPCLAEPCPLYEPDGSERSVAVLEMRAGSASVHRLASGAIVRPSLASQPAR